MLLQLHNLLLLLLLLQHLELVLESLLLVELLLHQLLLLHPLLRHCILLLLQHVLAPVFAVCPGRPFTLVLAEAPRLRKIRWASMQARIGL